MESIIKQFNNMSIIFPRKGWLINNHRIFKNHSYTVEGAKMYWKAIDAAIKFWIQKKKTHLVQKGPQLGSLESEEGMMHDAENVEPKKSVKSMVVKLQHNNEGGRIKFASQDQNANAKLDMKRTSREEPTRHNENEFFSRPRFDRYHWYKNARDMDRGFGNSDAENHPQKGLKES